MTTCRVKLRSGVKYIMKINCPTKASGGAHSIYTIPPGKPWEHSSGCPTMGTSPGQPETREAGRIHHRRWVPYKPQFNTTANIGCSREGHKGRQGDGGTTKGPRKDGSEGSEGWVPDLGRNRTGQGGTGTA